ncbi:MAG: hypothetical protein OXC68_00830 [Aestuariivita sp.]|nr:hypothetical protein [Aestuariivita sp.]
MITLCPHRLSPSFGKIHCTLAHKMLDWDEMAPHAGGYSSSQSRGDIDMTARAGLMHWTRKSPGDEAHYRAALQKVMQAFA